MKRTPLYQEHLQLGARMVEFGGWEMPVNYPSGILAEHLATRKAAGLFDVSHMGRFIISGRDALPFLQYVLTNNVAAIQAGESQYNILANESGGAVDDTLLYMTGENIYLLVVNAANTEKDWAWLHEHKQRFTNLSIKDTTAEIAMLSLQGQASKRLLASLLGDARKLPVPRRNVLAEAELLGIKMLIARTGYTGEPLGFEMFPPSVAAARLWSTLLEAGREMGVAPVGLGARDTLRLEASLPLYGHELGNDAEGREIPIFALPVARVAVSFASIKGEYIGRKSLMAQFEETKLRMQGLLNHPKNKLRVPRAVMPVVVIEGGVARQGCKVFVQDRPVGYVTSGTVVPCWNMVGTGLGLRLCPESMKRPICLAYVDAGLKDGDRVRVAIRDTMADAVIVERHMRPIGGRFARPVLYGEEQALTAAERATASLTILSRDLVQRTHENTRWRQKNAINLIPSEQTPSPLVRLLSVADPEGRYAEHGRIKALGNVEVYYYQGTGFISDVEQELVQALKTFFRCSEVEVRVVSGQMANMAVFSGLVHYLNRVDRKSEPRRLRCVMNHYLGAGGHLSAQPLGGLKDYVAVDPVTERPAVVNFPLTKDNPYRIDLPKTAELIEKHKPELIALGKSMVLHREPIEELARMASSLTPKPIVMYDAAHVLGLMGPHFQQPFREGADIMTGSTHKTFFGTQRGIISSNMSEGTELEDLWNSIVRRAFPGSVSNHHLGTLLGLLMAAYEMNAYGAEYQKQVLANARSFARALKEHGLQVEGDPAVGYTETHQVVLRVGHTKGIEVAQRLEKNNIVVNYQALPDDEAFTAASGIRMGVQEMTRFGMQEADFSELAGFLAQVILHDRDVSRAVSRFRSRFLAMHYCLPEEQAKPLVQELLGAVL